MTSAFEHGDPVWRTSSYSGGNGDCVEVAPGTAAVAIRDSKHPGGGRLAVGRGSWDALLRVVAGAR